MNIFFLVLSGSIEKLILLFKKEKIILEEYLIILIKMKILKENEVLKKLKQINKNVIDIDYNNLELFCKTSKNFNYYDLEKKAKKDLINLGFQLDSNNEENILPSVENYIKVTQIKKNIKIENNSAKLNLYIPKYEEANELIKGDYLNYLTKNYFSENIAYICKEDCDIGYINKNKVYENTIFDLINKKLENIFLENKNKYYIFEEIDIDIFLQNYVNLLNYRKFKKGDKIFLQDASYEGVYLIHQGEINLSTKCRIKNFNKLIVELVTALKGFPEHVVPFELQKFVNIGENDDPLKNCDNKDDIKLINMGSFKEGDILGLNELYDHKSQVFNYTAECISDEVVVFFIHKKDFSSMLSKEKSLYNSVIQKVELRIKYMIGTIKNYEDNLVFSLNKNNIAKINDQEFNEDNNIIQLNNNNLNLMYMNTISPDRKKLSLSTINSSFPMTQSTLSKDKPAFRMLTNTSKKNQFTPLLKNNFCVKNFVGNKKTLKGKLTHYLNNNNSNHIYCSTNLYFNKKYDSHFKDKVITKRIELQQKMLNENKNFNQNSVFDGGFSFNNIFSLINNNNNYKDILPKSVDVTHEFLRIYKNDKNITNSNKNNKYKRKLPLLYKTIHDKKNNHNSQSKKLLNSKFITRCSMPPCNTDV